MLYWSGVVNRNNYCFHAEISRLREDPFFISVESVQTRVLILFSNIIARFDNVKYIRHLPGVGPVPNITQEGKELVVVITMK